MRNPRAGFVLVLALAAMAAPAGAETIIGPPELPTLTVDATTLKVPLSVAGPKDAYLVAARLEGQGAACDLAPVAVPANTTTEVTFSLTSCQLKPLGPSASLSLTSADAKKSLPVPIKPSDVADVERAVVRSLRWAVLTGLLTAVLGALLAFSGWKRAGSDPPSPPLPDGKIRPVQGGKKWRALPALPGRPIKDLDWSGGISAKLVFIGGGVTAILAAGDLLDPVMTKSEQTLVTAGVVTAALLVGVAPLIVAALQVDYVPKAVVSGKPDLTVGDRQLVASATGVVLAAAVTAAGVIVQVVALWDVLHYVGFGLWSENVLRLLAGGVIIYCSMVAGAITLQGRHPPIMDTPWKSSGGSPPTLPIPAVDAERARLGRGLLP